MNDKCKHEAETAIDAAAKCAGVEVLLFSYWSSGEVRIRTSGLEEITVDAIMVSLSSSLPADKWELERCGGYVAIREKATRGDQEGPGRPGAKNVESRAEVLCAMDCLVHHLNDEEQSVAWLRDAVPDGLPWDVLQSSSSRREEYMDIASDMSDSDFESCVHLFACIVKAECFRMKYEQHAFS